MKKILIQGLISGVLSAIICIIYDNLYQSTLGTSFDTIINTTAIVAACIIGCLLMSFGYMILKKWNKEHLIGTLNIIIVIASFASIISPITISLPLEIESPELFPGLVIPMHFFPALVYFSISPFFTLKK